MIASYLGAEQELGRVDCRCRHARTHADRDRAPAVRRRESTPPEVGAIDKAGNR